MNLKARLQKQFQKNRVPWEVIEQDYLLSWILEGFSEIPELRKNLVFKGGTALKKIYFGDYRFSQDLDFSVREEGTSMHQLNELIEEACSKATQHLQSLGENVELKCELYQEKKPHPEGQQAFVIHARLPWHRDFHTKVYAEMSFQEKILMNPHEKRIIHEYGETLEGNIYVYPLEEILAEKIRALLQFAKKLHERGWGRSRVRDYYDIWRILTSYAHNLNLEKFSQMVEEKCSHKGINFQGIDDIFQEKLILNMEKEWESWLSGIVTDIPDRNTVLLDLKSKLAGLFK